MNFSLKIYNNDKVFDVSELLESEVSLTSELNGVPSELNFTYAKEIALQNNLNISFEEGNIVEFSVNDNKIFKGYIFSKNRDKNQKISVKCYDQLRYLKNKESYTYINKKASDILKIIANDFKLKLGNIEDTKYIIPARNEDNQTLIDIILTALDETFTATKQKYYLYDDFGRLTLKNANDMFLKNIVIGDDSCLIDFSYKTDIDKETYNKIKLYKENKDTGKREIYIAKDSKTINKWGVLQYYESLPESCNDAQAKEFVQNLLEIYNRPKEELSIECLGLGKGEELIRAGNGIYVKIGGLGEINLAKACIISKCTHKFLNNEHKYSLNLLV